MLFFPALELFLLQPPTVEELTLQTYALTSRLKAATSHFGGFGAVTNDTLLFFFTLTLPLQLSQAAPAGNWIGTLMIHLFVDVTHSQPGERAVRLRMGGWGQRMRLR